MFIDENKASSLARFLSNYDYVILDTCSLMEESFPSWLDTLNQAKDYLTEDFVITVPEAAIAELKKHSHDRKNVDKRIPAIRALKIFKEAKRLKLLVASKKSHNQNFADNAIYSQVCEDRLTKKILVITQDKKLATDLKNLNNLNSQRGRKVSIFKISLEGKLEINNGEDIHQKKFSESEKKQLREKERAFAEKNIENFKKSKDFKPNDPLDSALLKALQADMRLNANLKNPNYSKENKISDIEAQLKLLSGLPLMKKASLPLVLPEDRLRQILQPLKNSAASVSSNPVVQLKPAEKKIETPKPVPSKNDAPTILVKAPAKKLWYGEGVTLPYALDQVAEHYGVLFRDVSIPYVSFIHGPVDVTQDNKEEILKKLFEGFKQSGSVEFNYSTFLVKGEKSQKGFRVYLDLNPVSNAQPQAQESPALTKAPEPKPAPIAQVEVPKTQKQEASPAPEKAEKTIKTEEKPRKTDIKESKPSTSTVKAVPNTSAAVPEGVTLVVGVPTDERKRGYIERTARREAMGQPISKPLAKSKTTKAKKGTKKGETVSEKPKKQVKKPASPAKQEKAKKVPADQPAPKKKEKSASPKPSSKPAPSSSKAKPSDKNAKASNKKAAVKPIDEALKEEKKLRANLGNSNYSNANKKADIQKQIERIGKLSATDQAKLGLGPDALKTMLSLL